MSEFEDKLNSLLSDPQQMGMLAQMAQSLMGESASQPEKAVEKPEAKAPGGFDPEMLARISHMMSRAGGEKNDKKALLEALKPYLAEKRRKKMDRAIQLARMARLADIAIKEYGGGENGL